MSLHVHSTENAGCSAAGTGAAGAAVETPLEWNDPDKVYQGYVERCMDKRGHDVPDWR